MFSLNGLSMKHVCLLNNLEYVILLNVTKKVNPLTSYTLTFGDRPRSSMSMVVGGLSSLLMIIQGLHGFTL